MTYRPRLVQKLRRAKAIFLAVLIVLTFIYLFILIINQDFRSQILKNVFFTISFIVTWLCLIIGFSSILTDFIILKKSSDIVRELNDLSYLDRLTGLPNRYSIDRISQKYDSPEKLSDLGCVLLVISNLKEINKENGRAGGDRIISDFCAILESVGTQYGLIGRNSGNEFLVIIEECDDNTLELFTGELERRVRNHNTISPELPIVLSYSAVLSKDLSADHFYTLITGAYKQFETAPSTLS
ncbi:GGDEF domain-containing protein [Butyrivibrio sp. AE3004]|uniref:GGDEF domain-containing protein n=1 Tax=Butyrivibrio sp. AE3004 TaxID=1506994 RepID=UPI0004948398|nr:diguanylate cyclase [Butyrivibrio sp. AE3004]